MYSRHAKYTTTVIIYLFLLVIGLFRSQHVLANETAQQLFEQHRPALFQISVIDKPSGNRSGLGSGFAITENLVATNFHVISQYLNTPEDTQIRLANEGETDRDVDIVAVDVINDLAVLRSHQPLPQVLQLSETEPDKGATIYALGNPYDLGMSLTEGNYNGIKTDSFPHRIHYSGPVNPGMSGGPTIDEDGSVVGINVATARNSVGFLVPVSALQGLLSAAELRPLDEAAMLSSIGIQLTTAQDQLMSQLLENEWPMEEFGGARVPEKSADFISCWGHSDDDKDSGIVSVSRGCNSDQPIRIKSGLNTSYIEYEFSHLRSDRLNTAQLYNQAERHFSGAKPGNKASEKDVANFQCIEDHLVTGAGSNIPDTPGRQFRVHFCSRAYINFEGLYDAFFVGVSTDRSNEVLFSHFTLAGFSQPNIQRFFDRFIRSVQ